MSAKYQVGTLWVDNSNPSSPVVWRCMVEGDKTTSVWAQISGGGGGAGISSYKFQYDEGDYVMAGPVAAQANITPQLAYDASGSTQSFNLTGYALYKWTPGANDISLTVGIKSYYASGGVQTFTAPAGGVAASLFGTANTTSGSNLVLVLMPIAKPPKLRKSLTSEPIDGVIHSYTYAATAVGAGAYSLKTLYFTRTNSFTPVGGVATSAPERVTPDYLQQDLIFAVSSSETGVDGVSWLDLNVDGRAWADVETL